MASSMVSGNFLRNVSGLKSIEMELRMAAPLNINGGSAVYRVPYGGKNIKLKYF